MVYSTPVHQLIVSNIKSTDQYRYDSPEDGKQCWGLLPLCNVTINYESNSTAAFLPVSKKASECCAINN